MNIKIKKKYVDGKVVCGAINDSMDVVIPFIYDKIKPATSYDRYDEYYICSKDASDALYYNDRLVIGLEQGYKFYEYLDDEYDFAHNAIIMATSYDGKNGIVKAYDRIRKGKPNFDIIYEFGKCEKIQKAPKYSGDPTIYKARLYRCRNVGNFEVEEIGYLTEDHTIVEPCYKPETMICNYFDEKSKTYERIELLKGYRYSEEKKCYLAFLAQKVGNQYIDIISNIHGDIILEVIKGREGYYFNGLVKTIPINREQKECIFGFCLNKETKKLMQCFKYKYRFAFSKVSPETCSELYENNNIKIIKDSKTGVIRWQTTIFEGHNKPIKGQDYIIEEVIQPKYDNIKFISDNFAIGEIDEYKELIVMENEGKYMTKKSTKVFANNYVSISKKDCFFECVKQDGKKDIIWCSSNVQSKLDGHSYAFDEINFVAAEDVDSAEAIGYKNDVAIIKTTKNGKVQVEDLHFDKDFSTYNKKGANPSSIVDASFNKNNGTYTLFFDDGTLMVYSGYTSSKPILTLNDSNLTAENSYIEYISEINMVAIKKDNQIKLYKHDLNDFCLESLLDRSFLDIKYLSYNTLIYSELIDNELYTTISSVHHESTIDYRGHRVKPIEYVHIKDSFVVESSINNCGSITYLIVSKIDPNTKQKLYGVLHLQSRKIIIGYEFTNINVIEKTYRDNTIIKFECTTPDGTVLKYDSDGFIEMDEPGFTRNRVQN